MTNHEASDSHSAVRCKQARPKRLVLRESLRTPKFTSHLNATLSRYASQLKGSEYRIDERVDLQYLSFLGMARIVMMCRGCAAFPSRPAKPFMARGSRIRDRHRLQFGRGLTVGENSYIDALSVNGVRLGDNCSIGRNTRIECTGNIQLVGVGLTVGDNVGLGTDCFYGAAGGITIGSDCLIGNFVSFHSENHRTTDPNRPIRMQGVTRQGIVVGSDCWIGAKSTILDGASIGDGCVIAAGSVVVAGRYRARTIYGGVPAREIGSRG